MRRPKLRFEFFGFAGETGKGGERKEHQRDDASGEDRGRRGVGGVGVSRANNGRASELPTTIQSGTDARRIESAGACLSASVHVCVLTPPSSVRCPDPPAHTRQQSHTSVAPTNGSPIGIAFPRRLAARSPIACVVSHFGNGYRRAPPISVQGKRVGQCESGNERVCRRRGEERGGRRSSSSDSDEAESNARRDGARRKGQGREEWPLIAVVHSFVCSPLLSPVCALSLLLSVALAR